MGVKILEVCEVIPESSLVSTCLPLTFFDLLWLRFPPVENIFFYNAPRHSETFFSSSVIPKLKRSLSLTLRHFLPLAGNLIWPPLAPNPFISYKNGDGVSFTVAQSDDDFHHLSTSMFRQTKCFQAYIPQLKDSHSQAPLVAVKATLFPGKGFCLGIITHHAILDAKSLTMFMKSWASISKFGEAGGLNTEFKPVFDRKTVRGKYSQLEKLYIDQLLKQNEAYPRSLAFDVFESPPDRVRGTFQLSNSDVKRLKEYVHARMRNLKHHKDADTGFYISDFTITFAHLIVCWAKAKGLLGEKVSFSIVVDCRARLETPLSDNYFGNSIGFTGGDLGKEDVLMDDGIISIAISVNKTIKKLENKVLEGAEKWLLSGTVEGSEERQTTTVSLAGSNKLDLYNTDFGWGRPRKVDVTSIDKTGAISLIEGRDGDGGVEIELSLSKDEMEKFASAFAHGLSRTNHIKSAL